MPGTNGNVYQETPTSPVYSSIPESEDSYVPEHCSAVCFSRKSSETHSLIDDNICTSETCAVREINLEDQTQLCTDILNTFGRLRLNQFTPNTRTTGCRASEHTQCYIDRNGHVCQPTANYRNLINENKPKFVPCSHINNWCNLKECESKPESEYLTPCQMPSCYRTNQSAASSMYKIKPCSRTPSQKSSEIHTSELDQQIICKKCTQNQPRGKIECCQQQDCLADFEDSIEPRITGREETCPSKQIAPENVEKSKKESSLSRRLSGLLSICSKSQKRKNTIASDTNQIMSGLILNKKDKSKKKNNSSKTSIKSKSSVQCGCSQQEDDEGKCTCHFPPAFSQYFQCTGDITGTCCCLKKKK